MSRRMAFLHLPPIRWLTSFYNPPPADFSYFESLFDMYNLYSSKTYLCFYCGVYNSEDEITFTKKALKKIKSASLVKDEDVRSSIEADNTKIKQDLMVSIYRLVQHYGTSLSKNHGDNLFHRLLLEGRIRVDLDRGARKY